MKREDGHGEVKLLVIDNCWEKGELILFKCVTPVRSITQENMGSTNKTQWA